MITLHKSRSASSLIGRGAGLAAVLLLGFGCAGEDGRQGAIGPTGPTGPQGPDGTPGELDPNLSTWNKALAGIGGEEALTGLTSFTIEASGSRLAPGEGHLPGASAELVSTFDLTVSHDIAADTIRLDYDRSIIFAGGVPLTYSEIIDGTLGYVDGDDSFFGTALSTTDMPSARWAAIRKQERLLNPQLILQDIAANPSIASEGGVALHNGAIHELLVVEDDVYPITLWVNASTGRIAKLTTMENDHLRRDIALEVYYHDWENLDGGIAFANSVFLVLGTDILHEEYRTAITVNPTLSTDLFSFPTGADPQYDAVAATWGETSHQFHQAFTSLGIPIDVPQTYVQATELQTGVWFLAGGSHNSLVVAQDSGIVVIEAPLYAERSIAILDWIASEASLSGKSVTHVVVTHHHHDHSAGVREFVAAGATPVVAAESAEFFARILRAPSTVAPDTLAQNPVTASVTPVPFGGSYTIADATNPVTAYHTGSIHADDLMLIHLPTGGYLFESDLYNPGNGGASLSAAFATELLDGIVGLGITVNTVVGGHGATAPLTELQDYVAALP